MIEPIQYFEFMIGTEPYTYTDAAESHDLNGQTYEPVHIVFPEPETGQESAQETLEIEVSPDLPLAALYSDVAPHKTAWLTVWRKEFGALDSTALSFWTGRVRNVRWTDEPEREFAYITVEPISAALRRQGLRANHGPSCRHFWGDARCGVNVEDYKTVTTVGAVSGLQILSSDLAAQADGYFKLGYVERVSTGDRRHITEHVGDTITIRRRFRDLAPGEAINVYAGDDYSLATCHAKFNNAIAFGGFDKVPKRNIFVDGVE